MEPRLKGKHVIFWTNAEHIQRDRGVLTGEVLYGALGGSYDGHVVIVRKKRRRVPRWRFIQVHD